MTVVSKDGHGATPPNLSHDQDVRDDQDVFLLACYAAFPLTLTSDLVYCLRENFLPQMDWYTSPLFLMSGVAQSVEHDLYEIEAPVRRDLLGALRDHCGDGFEAELRRLEDFMTAYVSQRLSQGPIASGLMGLGEEMRWMSLACLSPGQVKDAIEAYLKRVSERDDARERIRLATVLDSYAALLEADGMKGTLIRWADCVAQGDSIGGDDVFIEEWFEAQGIPLKNLEFDKIELVPESEIESDSSDGLETLTFQTIKVDAQGDIIDRPEYTVKYFDEEIGSGESIRMIAIPSGEFMMGSPEGQGKSDEYPQHSVQVSPFFMSETPVTQKQWKTVLEQSADISSTDLNLSPSRFNGEDRPVEQVSWHDVTKFCQVISTVTYRSGYRLPTEAEWEYACRAGSTKDYACGAKLTPKMAHFSSSETANVKESKIPNAFGLYDMHGNVWEWCEDTWHKDYQEAPTDGSAWISNDKTRVRRGGSWIVNPWFCRSAFRFRSHLGERDVNDGFRLVLSLPRIS